MFKPPQRTQRTQRGILIGIGLGLMALGLGLMIALVFALACEGAQLPLGYGTVANDGNGDPIRTTFAKIQTNTTELYSNVTAVIAGAQAGSNFNFNGNQFATTAGTNVALRFGARGTNLVAVSSNGLPGLSVADGAGNIYRGLMATNSGIVVTDTNGNATAWLAYSGAANFAAGTAGATTIDPSGATFAGGNASILNNGDVVTAAGKLATTNYLKAVVDAPAIVLEGDSLTTGEYASDAESYGVKLLRLSNFSTYRLYTNFAASGNQLTANMSGQYATETHTVRVSPTNSANGNPIWFLWGGINDFRQDVTAATVIPFSSNMLQSARADGFTVVVLTVPIWGSADSNATRQAERVLYNNWLRANYWLYDYLVDVDAMFPWDTSTRIADLLHLTAAANQLLAATINSNIPPRKPAYLAQRGGSHFGVLKLFPFGPGDDAYPYTNPIVQFFGSDGTKGMELSRRGFESPDIISLRAPQFSIGFAVNFAPGDKVSLAGGDFHFYNGANLIIDNGGNFMATNGGIFKLFMGTNMAPGNHTVFAMTADGSLTNITTTTNSVWGAGTGSRRLDANWFAVGRSLDAEVDGNYWTGATPGNCRFLAMLNTSSATNVAAQVLFGPAANITAGDYFKIKTRMTCRTTGASGTVSTTGSIEMQNAGAAVTRYFTNAVLTIDTTAQLTFEIGATNGASTDSFLARNGILNLR